MPTKKILVQATWLMQTGARKGFRFPEMPRPAIIEESLSGLRLCEKIELGYFSDVVRVSVTPGRRSLQRHEK